MLSGHDTVDASIRDRVVDALSDPSGLRFRLRRSLAAWPLLFWASLGGHVAGLAPAALAIVIGLLCPAACAFALTAARPAASEADRRERGFGRLSLPGLDEEPTLQPLPGLARGNA